jgi:hypothetical protein
MKFTFQYQFYDTITDLPLETKFNPKNEILVFTDETYYGDIHNIVVAADSSIQLFSGWFEELHTYNFDKSITYPPSLLKQDDNNMIIIPVGDSLAVLPFYIYPGTTFGTALNDSITDSPIPISNEEILVPTKNEIIVYTIDGNMLTLKASIPATNQRVAFNKETNQIVVTSGPHTIMIFDLNPLMLNSSYSIPSELGKFYPIIEYNDSIQTIYIQDKIGSVYKIAGEGTEKIFSAQSYNFQSISNISLGDIDNNGTHDIVFTADNTIYAVQSNGAFVSWYPNAPYYSEYSPQVSPIIGSSFLSEEISLFLPTSKQWTQAISIQGEPVTNYSFAIGNSSASPYLSTNGATANFFLPVADSVVKMLSINGIDKNSAKLYWNGYKNGPERSACVYTPSSGSPPPTRPIKIYAFPNPAEKGDVRIRIIPPNDGKADIKIYDLAANLLFKDTIEDVSADTNNEFVWNIDNVSSGIYFAIVNIKGTEKLIKIGVTK